MDEEYILKWKDYQSNFFSLAEDLFTNELLTDVTLACRDQLFEAHRIVLSVCSPYFRAILTKRTSGHQAKHPIIFLKDIEPVQVERLLQYMYYGEVKMPNGEMSAFLAAGNSLNIRGLCSLPKKPAEDLRRPAVVQETQVEEEEEEERQRERKRRKRGSSERWLQQQSSSGKENLQQGEQQQQHQQQQQQTPLIRPLAANFGDSRLLLLPLPPPPPEEASSIKMEVVTGVEYENAVSPPPSLQSENIPPLVLQDDAPSSSSFPSASARTLPPNEPRKSGTCYFCKKAFMKNKQLMNHYNVCPKKPPLLDSGGGIGGGCQK